MHLTNFPNGMTSMGVPIQGNSGFPYTSGGSHFYTDSVNGSDSADGKTWATAKASIWGTYGGYSLLTTNKHDVLHVLGGATAYAETAVGTWAHSYTHCVAETNPIMSGGRARITNTVQTATGGEWVISGSGCHFSGLHFQWGASAKAESLVGVSITGIRNSFSNCNFEGPIDATIGAATGIRTVTLGTGVQDTWFYGCKFGQRTIENTDATGALVEFLGSNNTDNGFVNCIFTMFNSNVGACAVSFVLNAMPDSGITTFAHCAFQNHHTAATTDVIRTDTTAHGIVQLHYCTLVGNGTSIWSTTADEETFTNGPAGSNVGGVCATTSGA
jgi:hypothetical protein